MTKVPFVLDDITKWGRRKGGWGVKVSFSGRNCRKAA